MGTRGYEYNHIRVRIHIIMGSQIPFYYTRGYPFNYLSRACDGFYLRVPMSMGIFATPTSPTYRGGKKIRARGYPQIKSVMGTGRVVKRVPTGIINGYLTTRYFMDTDTDLMIPVPAGIRTR